MNQKLTATFDGQVLHPDTPVDLKPNTRYLITIQNVADSVENSNAWDVLETLAGSVEAPGDWSVEHDQTWVRFVGD